MTNLAIQFDHVGKLYQLGVVGTGTLTHDLNRWWHTKVLHHEDPFLKIGEVNDRSHRGSSDFVWALKDISFNVEQGDVVGIIGKNGAGKSTLLKLLSRITSPTTGVIRAHGRIASLLEVGTGFHPEMTGRENIYMNGAIMGMTRREIASKLDEIVDFAGVERYLDTPVKRYSSGMTVRLGFAVAAFLEPEILVVDEVLAVGDAEFQKKAIGKMQDVSRGQGRTVLFVSHNMAAVRNLCNRGIVIDNGLSIYDDIADKAINYYQETCKINHGTYDFSSRKVDNKIVYINNFSIINENGEKRQSVLNKDKLHFLISIKSGISVSVSIRIAFFDVNENRILVFDSSDVGIFFTFASGELKIIQCDVIDSLNIRPGDYHINVSIRQGSNLLDYIRDVQYCRIEEDDFYEHGCPNVDYMPIVFKHHSWEVL